MEEEASSGANAGKNKYAVFDLVEDNQAAPKTIHEAAERGFTGVIVRLVERNVEFDINQRDKYQRTALHWAAEMGRIECAEALLDYGADIKATECNGRTAIHLASRSGDADMLKVLLEGINDKQKEELVNQGDHFKITPVFLAMQKGEEGRAAFELLMLNGAKFNQQSYIAQDPVNELQ